MLGLSNARVAMRFAAHLFKYFAMGPNLWVYVCRKILALGVVSKLFQHVEIVAQPALPNNQADDVAQSHPADNHVAQDQVGDGVRCWGLL
jgi:hypothetical protein